ncbi:hypothetical protein ISN44_As06g019890 [Arabidopsis suecica]|uniref:Uncharacterized protein n=1 Tax=Arabidopsis suecica TaxID=45249 RepID=A0A8T2CRT3_ARASU|nr:hypothetical protein ISN44_As06g019890 [Arabidopsis suecica]
MEETRALTKMEEAVVRETAETLGLRIKKLHRRISWEEFNERWFKGLCMFCDEPETPDHHLRHKNSGILMIDCDEDQMSHDKELVETEVATESSETEQRTVSHEATADMNLALLEEGSIPQFQVPIANSEILRNVEIREENSKLETLEYVVMNENENLEQDGVQKYVSMKFEVDGDAERSQKVLSSTKNCCAHQVFGKMSQPVRTKLLQNLRKKRLSKTWWFKFKELDVMQEDVQHVLLAFLQRSAIKTRYDIGEHDEMFKVSMTVSVRCMLGLKCGITVSDAGHGEKYVYDRIIMVNEQLSHNSLVIQEVMRNNKIKFSKRWWFKYKSVEEGLKRLSSKWCTTYYFAVWHCWKSKTMVCVEMSGEHGSWMVLVGKSATSSFLLLLYDQRMGVSSIHDINREIVLLQNRIHSGSPVIQSIKAKLQKYRFSGQGYNFILYRDHQGRCRLKQSKLPKTWSFKYKRRE